MPGRFKGKTIPIKVVIGLRPNGHADHPDWDQLPLVQGGENEQDHQSSGWFYDKSSGHEEETAESPRGQQIGVMFVSEQFANEAIAAFPGKIEKFNNENQLKRFIEDNCTAHLPEFRMDPEELLALNTEHELLTKLGQSTAEVEARITKALDPNDLARGKRKQKGKKFDDIKTELAIDLSPLAFS